MKNLFVLLVFSVVIFCLSSCGGVTEAKREGCNFRVGIVFDIGGKNDRSFNSAAWEGVKRAEDFTC